jgi:tetratricopeptide (TPR) repeat protein
LYDAKRMGHRTEILNKSPRQSLRVWIWSLVCGFLIAPSISIADVIYLKNGRKIDAQIIKEDEKQIYFEASGGEFAILKSSVDHVEKSNVSTDAPVSSRPGRLIPLPFAPPVDSMVEADSPVVHDDAVDEAYLARLTDAAATHPTPDNLHKLKQALQAAAVFLSRKGQPEAAIAKYRDALKYMPHDQGLDLALGYLLCKQEHYFEAVDLLLPEADRYPRDPDFRLLLGSAYYGMEDLDQAIAQWNKALEMADNAQLRDAVAKAEREREVSGNYVELRSEHFLLRYDGQQNDRLSGEILNSLNESFQNLVLDLDYSPSDPIVVIIYPNQAFRDITRVPSWVGALNDGKIRIPVSGLTEVTPRLAQILRHELTHSFVRLITLGKCPVWFNEGIAQLEEGASTARLGSQLGRDTNLPPYSSLEGPFVNLPADQVPMVYAKSLAALEYLRDNFGIGEVRHMLQLMAAEDMGTVMHDEIRSDYPELEQDVANYVVKKYGP